MSCDPRRSADGCPNPCRGHPAHACRRRPAFESRARDPRHTRAGRPRHDHRQAAKTRFAGAVQPVRHREPGAIGRPRPSGYWRTWNSGDVPQHLHAVVAAALEAVGLQLQGLLGGADAGADRPRPATAGPSESNANDRPGAASYLPPVTAAGPPAPPAAAATASHASGATRIGFVSSARFCGESRLTP